MRSSLTFVPWPRASFAVTLLALATSASAQIQPTWVSIQTPIPGPSSPDGHVHRVAVDGAGSIHAAAVIDTYPGQGLTVMKLDAAGASQWNSTFPHLAPQLYPKDIQVSSNGATVVAGIAGSDQAYGATPTHAVLAYVDAAGVASWSSVSPASAGSIYADVEFDAAGNVLTCGSLGLTGVVRKHDASGTLVWQSVVSNATRVYSLEVGGSGDVFVVGKRTDLSPFVARLDAATGTTAWIFDLGANSPFSAEYGLFRDGLGSIYIAGATGPEVSATTELVRMSESGTVLWRTPLPIGLGSYQTCSMLRDVYGRIVVGGPLRVAVVTTSGTVAWARIHEAALASSHGLATDAAGSIYQVGIRMGVAPTRGAVAVYDASGEQRFVWDDYSLNPARFARRIWSAGNSSTGSVLIVGLSGGADPNDFYIAELERTSRAFCFGDGSGTSCPCGNGTAVGLDVGCANSFGTGARLVDAGASRLSDDTFALNGSGMPNSSAMYFQGTLAVAGGAGSVFGDGLRCAGGAIIRLGVEQNVGGASSYPAVGDAPVSVRGLVPAPATSRTYQVWYRNSASFCTSSTFNLTNALEVTWTN